MRAVFAAPELPGIFEIREAPEPVAGPSDALVAVRAVSLNPGEIRMSIAGIKPRPGWDLAGEVLEPAADGSGPARGSRVVGFVYDGAWGERVAVPTRMLAAVPASVPLEQACCLPVAGLTALRMLSRAGQLLGRKVLVTGASGSVGGFACRLARLSGAWVAGALRNESRAEAALGAGAHEVVITADYADTPFAPFDVVVDTVGTAPGTLLSLLAEGGLYVTGMVRDPLAVADPSRIFFNNVRMEYFTLLRELRYVPASDGLARLLALLAHGEIEVSPEVVRPWEEVAEACGKVLDRSLTGKVVLRIG